MKVLNFAEVQEIVRGYTLYQQVPSQARSVQVIYLKQQPSMSTTPTAGRASGNAASVSATPRPAPGVRQRAQGGLVPACTAVAVLVPPRRSRQAAGRQAGRQTLHRDEATRIDLLQRGYARGGALGTHTHAQVNRYRRTRAGADAASREPPVRARSAKTATASRAALICVSLCRSGRRRAAWNGARLD